MAQRQFASDDTSVWGERYGNAKDGALSQNSATDSTPNTNCTGSLNSPNLSVGSGSGFNNGDIVLIHQSQGSGADTSPNWELNKITSGGGTSSWTMEYNLTNTYSAGAQVYKLFQYSTAEINVGQTLNGNPWNGTTGGIYAILACQSITIAGTINMNGTGFRGGQAGNNSGNYNSGATAGEGYNGQAATINAQTDNANGGASGAANSNMGVPRGGANANLGQWMNGGGVAVGNARLSCMVFGGGGGGLSRDTQSGQGSNGAGIVILIAPQITITGSISLSTATTTLCTAGGSPSASAGTGAAGDLLCKGQLVNLGSNLVNVTASTSGGGSNSGGQGSVGRVHVDSVAPVTGSVANVTIDTRTDPVLANNSAAALLI